MTQAASLKAINFKIPFSGKSRQYRPNEIDAVVRAMKEADPETQGKYQKAFETDFSSYLHAPNSFAVSSGTAALELAAVLSKLGPGDEVILPAHTFAATAIPFARTGAKLVWADIDPATLVISPKSIRRNLTSRTRAIIVVHLYGLVADMEEILKIACTNELIVIEDCAHALGAHFHNKKAGTFGDFACFSFHSHKNITTLGEGGMLTVASQEIAKKVLGMRHNGIRPYPFEKEDYWKPAMSLVDFDDPGIWPYNFCIGEAQCALGSELIKGIDRVIEKRNKRAQILIKEMNPFPELSFQRIPAGRSSTYHLLVARYDAPHSRVNRDDLIKIMAYEYGVQLVVQYCPLYRYPMFQKAGFGKADCPESDLFFDNMVSFPFHEWLSEKDFKYMIDATKAVLKSMRNLKLPQEEMCLEKK